jgi:hypothetical protein
MYQANLDDGPVIRDLAQFIREGFATLRAPAMA